MTMDEIVDQVNFMLGVPSNENVEGLDTRQAVLIAFRELKRYMRTPVNKTVPFSTRIDLLAHDIHATNVLYVYAAYPKIGLAMSNVDSGNVFQLAAAVNYGAITSSSTGNIDPIVTQLTMAQTANTMSQDFQWTYDKPNQVVYCTCKYTRPNGVTIRYVPDLQDVSEIQSQTWIDYLVRMSEANMKKALGRTRSKYAVEGSNVSLDGDRLLEEANTELQQIREELEGKLNRMVVLN